MESVVGELGLSDEVGLPCLVDVLGVVLGVGIPAPWWRLPFLPAHHSRLRRCKCLSVSEQTDVSQLSLMQAALTGWLISPGSPNWHFKKKLLAFRPFCVLRQTRWGPKDLSATLKGELRTFLVALLVGRLK